LATRSWTNAAFADPIPELAGVGSRICDKAELAIVGASCPVAV
jgi:hypothetical protein